jgi:predicted RNA-binding Zn-ribbon protein involved in translation (DUF1610 family)
VQAVDPRARGALGPFACPGCGEPLLPRLGRLRAHHFAHRPGAACPLTAPETALHFNAKARLLLLAREATAGARRVTVLTRCPACRRTDPRDLGALGDAAEAEGSIGALRADVLVSRAGRPALAVEVRVTHALDPEKEAALAAAGVPAVEVDAGAGWERAGPAGPEVVPARSLGFPPCAACAAGARADRDREAGGEAAAIAELEAYRARGLLPVATDGNPSEFQTVDLALTPGERAAVRAAFHCPDCGGRSLEAGERLLRHPCPEHGLRPVAWRGYDGRLATLSWWKRRGT